MPAAWSRIIDGARVVAEPPAKTMEKSMIRYICAALLSCVVLVFSIPSANAKALEVIGPIHDEGIDVLGTCGDFDVVDNWVLNFTLRFMLDRSGNRVRLVEETWGVDNFTNSVTGKTIAGPYHNNTFVDFDADRAITTGVIFKAVVPGAGAVFLDIGRIVFVGEDGSVDGPQLLQNPFDSEPGWGVSAVTFDIKALLAKGRKP